MKRENDPNAGAVGKIFLNLLGIKSPREISYKSGIGVVFELKAKEDGSSVLLCLPKEDFYAGLLQEVENEFYREFDPKRFAITLANIHWLTSDDLFGRTIHDGNIWGTPYADSGETIAIAATIGLTESEAKSRRYDDTKTAAISKAESLIEEMCADIALPSFRLGVYDNALAAMDGQGALEVSLCGFKGVGVNKLHALAEGIQTRLDAMCPEIGWEIIKRTDRSVGTIAVLELQLSHTKPYLKEDA